MTDSNNSQNNRIKKGLAKMVYDKHGETPPDEGELRYIGKRNRNFLVTFDEVNYAGKFMTHVEVRLWKAIFMHNWNPDPSYRVSWPGRKRLAILIGKSPDRVSRTIGTLKRKGLLLWKRRLGKSSLYVLKDPPVEWSRTTKRKLAKLDRRRLQKKT